MLWCTLMSFDNKLWWIVHENLAKAWPKWCQINLEWVKYSKYMHFWHVWWMLTCFDGSKYIKNEQKLVKGASNLSNSRSKWCQSDKTWVKNLSKWAIIGFLCAPKNTDVFWFILICFDAFWHILTHFDVFWWVLIDSDRFW